MSISRPPRVLVTAGPTHEPIDAVRYLGNRSSGRMGLAIAQACLQRGWPTTLLLGPVALQPPEDSHVQVERFQSAADLAALLARHWPNHDVLFMAAAVADFTPVHAEIHDKMKRGGGRMTLELAPTPDLLANLASTTRPDQIVIGFALEPAARLAESAKTKLATKRLHAIVANPLETIGSDQISGRVFTAAGAAISAPANLSKSDFANWLLDALGLPGGSAGIARSARPSK